jgi:hypothetical protein
VKNELSVAQQKIIIPFRLDDSVMGDDLEYDLSRRQWMEVLNNDMEGAVARLVDSVQQHLSNPANTGITSPPQRDVFLSDDKKKRTRYFLIAAIAFLIAAALFVLLAFFHHRLTGLLGERAYYILLFPLAAAVGAFFFGGMRSWAVYRGNRWNSSLQIGGSVLASVAVVVGGFLLPAEASFDFTIQLQPQTAQRLSPAYPPLKDATLVMRLAHESKPALQREHLDFDYKQLPVFFRNRSVALRLQARYWRLVRDSVQLTGRSATLYVEPDGSLRRITGTVSDAQTAMPIADAVVIAAGARDVSDANGTFTLIIPVAQQMAEYRVSCQAVNYKTEQLPATPATGQPLRILLSRNRR